MAARIGAMALRNQQRFATAALRAGAGGSFATQRSYATIQFRTLSRKMVANNAPPLARFHFARTFASAPMAFLDKKEVTERVLTVVKNFDKVDAAKVAVGAKFKEDLGLDSLDAVEIIMACEDEFSIEIPDAEADKILTPEDVVAFIVSHPQAK